MIIVGRMPKSKEVRVFATLAEAASRLDVDKSSVSRAISGGGYCKGWSFERKPRVLLAVTGENLALCVVKNRKLVDRNGIIVHPGSLLDISAVYYGNPGMLREWEFEDDTDEVVRKLDEILARL